MSDNLPTRIRLVVSDIDGTLVPKSKQLTEATISAARALRRAGIALCLVSSRAPRGMQHFLEPLDIVTPYAGLNGGLIVQAPAEGTEILSRLSLPENVAREAVAGCEAAGVHPWLFRGHDWLVRDRDGPYVAHEAKTVRTEPIVVDDFGPYCTDVGKIMGASEDFDGLAALEHDLAKALEGQASVARSSNYYLDITHPDANKGHAARELARLLGIPMEEVACIGDMSNDVPMLRAAGLGIAMGNATDRVKKSARVVTLGNEADGWSYAMEEYVLPRAP